MQDAPVISYVQDSDSWLKRTLVNLVEVSTGRERLTRIYRELCSEPFAAPRFFRRAIELGRLELEYNRRAEQLLPKAGPLVFIANHPFGIVDGLILCEMASRLRGDFRILLNSRLMQDENLNRLFLPVDFDGGREAARRNIETRRRAREQLQRGGALIVFPGGGVATRWRFGLGPLEALPWTTFTAKIIKESRATVAPVCFEGENSFLFHFASSISESLRLSLFIREVTRQVGTRVRFTIGEPIPFGELEHIDSRRELTAHLRERVESLSGARTHGRAASR